VLGLGEGFMSMFERFKRYWSTDDGWIGWVVFILIVIAWFAFDMGGGCEEGYYVPIDRYQEELVCP